MSLSLLILDGLVVLTFLVAWAESSVDKNFRFTPIRFLRAISIPCFVIWLLHNAAARHWPEAVFQALPKPPDSWWWILLGPFLGALATLVAFILFLWSIFGLLLLIGAQFFEWRDFVGKR